MVGGASLLISFFFFFLNIGVLQRGRVYLFFNVLLFSSIHNSQCTSASSHPLSNNSCSCVLSSFSSAGAIRYRALEIGSVSSCSSILKSTSHVGVIPGKSSSNTPRNSFVTNTWAKGVSSFLVFMELANITHAPC